MAFPAFACSLAAWRRPPVAYNGDAFIAGKDRARLFERGFRHHGQLALLMKLIHFLLFAGLHLLFRQTRMPTPTLQRAPALLCVQLCSHVRKFATQTRFARATRDHALDPLYGINRCNPSQFQRSIIVIVTTSTNDRAFLPQSVGAGSYFEAATPGCIFSGLIVLQLPFPGLVRSFPRSVVRSPARSLTCSNSRKAFSNSCTTLQTYT